MHIVCASVSRGPRAEFGDFGRPPGVASLLLSARRSALGRAEHPARDGDASVLVGLNIADECERPA